MFVKKIVVGPFQMNCYIVGAEETKEAIIIDPGDNAREILDIIAREKIHIKKIVNTHCHIDHVGAVEEIRKTLNVPFLIHKADEPFLKTVSHQAMMFGLPPFSVNPPDGYVAENDIIPLGTEELTVLETPGHSMGGITLSGPGIAFVGDLLFAGSVGRTDLPGGSFDILKQSIFTKIVPLGENTIIYSGHGPDTTVGDELKHNPFLR